MPAGSIISTPPSPRKRSPRPCMPSPMGCASSIFWRSVIRPSRSTRSVGSTLFVDTGSTIAAFSILPTPWRSKPLSNTCDLRTASTCQRRRWASRVLTRCAESMGVSAWSPTTIWAGNGSWMCPFPGIDSPRRAARASRLPGSRGFLDEFPHPLVAERLHALPHAGRPVGTVLVHLAQAGGDLRVASGKGFHEFFPACRQTLGYLAGGIFPECGFHVTEEVRPFPGPAFLIFRRPELFALFDLRLRLLTVIFF